MDNNNSHKTDDFNTGTIDEKMCPRCGKFLPKAVSFCTECGFNFSEKEKNSSSPSAVTVIAAAVVIALLTGGCCVFFLLKDMLASSGETSEADIITEPSFSEALSSEPVTEMPENDGIYEMGTYKIGKDIPKGAYILTGAMDDAYYGLYSDPECNNTISSKWFKGSAIVNLETDDYVEFLWCNAVALEDFDGENSPFEHSGMFRCGVDFEPGTYELVPTTDQGYQMYYVHDSVRLIEDGAIYALGNHGFENGTKVTVKEGEILELSWCILEKMNKSS